ncbi:MAG: MFS transporter [Candidatus Bathyarchaeia archaeon]
MWLKNITLHEGKGKKENIPKMCFIWGYINALKNKETRFMMVIRLMRDSAFQSLITFMPLWLVRFRGVTGSQLGFLVITSTFASLACQIPIGKLADTHGRKRTFYVMDAFYCFGVLLSIFAPNEYLFLAAICGMGVFGGGIGGAAMVPFFTMWWESVPVNDIARLYGLDGVIISTARIFSLFLGILWDLKLNEIVLLIPVLIELLIVMPLLSKIRAS